MLLRQPSRRVYVDDVRVRVSINFGKAGKLSLRDVLPLLPQYALERALAHNRARTQE